MGQVLASVLLVLLCRCCRAVWLEDCNTEVLGCWQDSKPGDKAPGATGHRVLPYSVCPGGAPGQAAAGQCKTPDCKYEGRAAPPCEAAKITPRECAQKCLDWVATPPPSAAYTIWSGVEWTQECWCVKNRAVHARVWMAPRREHKAPAPGCTAKCRGDSSITCGGPGGPQGSAISIMKIECGYVDDGWGFSVILLFLIVGSAYAGGGIAWNAKMHGKRGRDALPHQHFWRELYSLVIDGVAVTKRKLGMQHSSDIRRGGSKAMGSRLLTKDTIDPVSPKSGEKRSEKGTKEKRQKQKQKNKDKGKDNGKHGDAGTSTAASTAHGSPSPATAAPAAGGTAAGGGGRWVHVPN